MLHVNAYLAVSASPELNSCLEKKELIRMNDGLDYIIHEVVDHKTGLKTGEKRLFCPSTGEFFRKGRFSKKQKRHFRILRSGFELTFARHERLSFLTLSTQYDTVKDQNGNPVLGANGKPVPVYPRKMQEKQKGLNLAWTKIKQAIERKIQSILYERYCKRHKIEPYIYVGKKHRKKVNYRRLFVKFRYRLRYFKLRTSEGGGVLHIVFRKGWHIPSIPYKWLRNWWFRVWGAKNGVNIKGVELNDAAGLSFYLVGQYFIKQPIIRMSYGYSWIGTGVKKRIIRLMSEHGAKKGFDHYKALMQNNRLPTGSTGYQSRLRWRLLPSTYFRLYLRQELLDRQKNKPTKYLETSFWISPLGSLCMVKGLTRLVLE